MESKSANTEPQVSQSKYRRILGVNFFTGTAVEAVDLMKDGGLLVAPSGPGLAELPFKARYSEALLNADVVITDSAFMVLLWRIVTSQRVARLSGLEFLREFLSREVVRQAGSVFWVMAGEGSAARNLNWLSTQGIEVSEGDWYIAPFYCQEISDPELVRRIQAGKYAHVVITIGGGTQEQLGLYLKRNLNCVPSIYCIGAAIAFLSGDQVHIPIWADRNGLGWLFRCFSNPNLYIKRYWAARKLAILMFRYHDRLPVTKGVI